MRELRTGEHVDPITLVMAYYENPGMLQFQYDSILKLPASVRAFIHLVIVDDGSPDHPALAPERDLGIVSTQIYRVGVDIRWNQDACRNIGVRHAETEWVLLTDMDHVVPEETWKYILSKTWERSEVITFSRIVMPERAKYKPHPNSWLLSKRLYDDIGGYDERFAGIYGTDGDFRDRLRAITKDFRTLHHCLELYPRSVISDASTTKYLRKQPEDDIGKRRVKAERAAEKNKFPKRYLFPYHKVES